MEWEKQEFKINERKIYPEQFKRQVIEEYLRTGVSKMSLLAKHGICYKSAIQKWMRDLGYTDLYAKLSPLNLNHDIEMAKEFAESKPEADSAAMARRIKELERALADEKLRSEAYRLTIEIAEKELNIPIRKKRNTK